MREILGPVSALLVAGKPVALARVVEVVGSGVHPAGAAIAVSEDGDVFGSASGGCVESALVDEARAMLASGGPPRLRTFGCSDDEAFDIGLTCGGLVRVLIERLGPATQDGAAFSWARELAEIGRSGKGAALVEVIDGPEDLLGSKTVVCEAAPAETGPVFGPAVLADALADLAEERSASHTYPVVRGDLQVDVTMFVDAFPAPPLMLVVGAASFACALTAQAKLLGYKVVVCDARAVFASPRRFPLADEVVVEWPNRYLERTREAYQERDAICVLTHDPKFDVPTIVAALATAAGYIGVMGSRRTQADRRRRLREAGVDEAQLGRLRGPLGLDLGARSPEETAVSICAEIIAARRGGAGGPLATSAGPIHPGRPANPTAPGLLGPGATPDPPDGQR